MNSNILFPNEIVISTTHFTIAQDWEVPIVGFFIISSHRKQVRTLSEFNDLEAQEFIFLLRKLRKGMSDILKIQDVYLFQNEDTQHGFHFWMFPRHRWMEPLGRKIESIRTIMNYATKVQTLGPIIEHACHERKSEEFCKEVRGAVRLMKEYMEENWKKIER